MIEIKITAENATELSSQIAALALLAGGAVPAASLPAPALAVEETAAPKSRGRKAAEPKADEGKADASVSATSTQPEASASEPSAPQADATASSEETKPTTTYADVQAAVTKLAAKKGRDAVIAVFEQFGVDHGSKLTEAQWPEAITAMGDALTAEPLA